MHDMRNVENSGQFECWYKFGGVSKYAIEVTVKDVRTGYCDQKTSEECKGGFLSITKGKQEPNLSCSKNANIFCGHPTSLTDVKKFGPGESVTIKFFIAAKKNNKGFKFIVDYRKDERTWPIPVKTTTTTQAMKIKHITTETSTRCVGTTNSKNATKEGEFSLHLTSHTKHGRCKHNFVALPNEHVTLNITYSPCESKGTLKVRQSGEPLKAKIKRERNNMYYEHFQSEPSSKISKVTVEYKCKINKNEDPATRLLGISYQFFRHGGEYNHISPHTDKYHVQVFKSDAVTPSIENRRPETGQVVDSGSSDATRNNLTLSIHFLATIILSAQLFV